jgi:hypothetical protein
VSRLALLLILILSGDGASAGEARALRVMPLGDSITEAASGYASYRYWLAKALESRGRRVDFVGSRRGVLRGSPRFDDFDSDHEGHWGWTSGQVLERIDGWAATARPDVVLLHLGSNDLGRRDEIIVKNLSAIIDRLRRANAEVVVLLARLIPLSGMSPESLDRVNDSIERMAREKSTDRSPVDVVRQDEGFDVARDTYDGIHPSESGEKKMAARWLDALEKRVFRGPGSGSP